MCKCRIADLFDLGCVYGLEVLAAGERLIAYLAEVGSVNGFYKKRAAVVECHCSNDFNLFKVQRIVQRSQIECCITDGGYVAQIDVGECLASVERVIIDLCDRFIENYRSECRAFSECIAAKGNYAAEVNAI